jgi:Trypsin
MSNSSMRFLGFQGSLVHGLTAALACVMAACGVAGNASNAVGDTQDADILAGTAASLKATVLLADRNSQASCTGTLIAPDVVLTAAHCLEVDQAYVYVGYSRASSQLDLPTKPEPGEKWYRVKIKKKKQHPGWGTTTTCPEAASMDVALVQLAEPIVDVKPLLRSSAMPAVGADCIVVGYGRHNVSGKVGEVEANVTDWTYAERRQAAVKVIGTDGEAGTISVNGVDGAPSRGDSGGLLLCKGRVAGVTSCSVGQNQTILKLEKVFVSVEAEKAFIEETIEAWGI